MAVDSTVENKEKAVESLSRRKTFVGEKGAIRAERKIEAVLYVDTVTYLIVGFFDKAVMFCVVPQSKDKKEN